ncbi:MAG: transglycosylase SLT domain-containing protein [Myxococcales bacterium]|nr:transglycosylase SLT domain-containing protein [Myxococcales bacterium]
MLDRARRRPSAGLSLSLAIALTFVACEQRPAATPGAVDAQVAIASGPLDASAPPAWAELVRQERYAEAAKAIDALTEAARQQPELRYLRARVALELGDGTLAHRLLDGLEAALPLLAEDVLDRRADAAMAKGRFAEAGERYASKASLSQQLKASRAFERALDAARARSAADRVVAGKTPRRDEAEARARRLRLGGRSVREDIDDARWLAVEGADLPEAEGALARLAALEPTKPLDITEQTRRARVLGDAGRVDDAIKAVEEMPQAAGPLAQLERLKLRAEIFYKSRSHAREAARAYDECVKFAGPRAVEESFKAARALSRADRDDEAIERFLHLARRAPTSPWGEEALFLAARLELLHGRSPKAARLFDEHKKAHGDKRKEATRLRALSYLLAGYHSQAIQLFEQLSDDDREPLAAARARTMAALAAQRAGDRTLAVARWTDVARSRPLSWPALVARARLAEMKAAVPASFEPAPTVDTAPADPIRVNLPPPVDLLHRLGLDDDAEAALRERESAVTAAAPGRSTEALCAAYGALGRGRRRYQVAQQIPQSALFAAPTPRARWTWQCAYPAPWLDDVSANEATFKLPEGLVHAVMRQESGFDPDAVSPARAVGLMQLMPDTARSVAAAETNLSFEESQLTQPSLNVKLGARYMKTLLERFHDNVPLAVAGYNGGPDNVAKWAARLPTVPLDVFVEQIPYAETRGYVVRVLGNLARYAYLRGGDDALPKLVLAPLEPK